MKKKPDEKGFTLVEILVSLVIVSFLSVVIFATFLQGIRLWRYAMRERPEWQIDVFFDKLSSQLRNTFTCIDPSLQGSESSLEFCTLMPAREIGKSKESVRLPVGVRYSFDETKKTLFMDSKGYLQILYPAGAKEATQPVLKNIQKFEVEYYMKDTQNQAWTWKRKWSQACFPRAVKVSLDYGTPPKKITRFLPLMSSGACV